jgi:hypothetical protein
MDTLLNTINTCNNGKVKISACIALEKVVEKMGGAVLEDDVVLNEALRVLAGAFVEGVGAFRDQRALEAQLRATFLKVEGRTGGGVSVELREQLRIE